MASVKQLKYNLPEGGGEVFYPLTITEAVEDENGKALDLILTDVMGSMGDAFSETATYTVGDYCIYQDVLYKFIAAKSAGAWDVNAVSKTTIDAELKSLLNQINTLNSGPESVSNCTYHRLVSTANSSVIQQGHNIFISLLINSSENIPDGTSLITLPDQYHNGSGYAYADLFDQSANFIGRICVEPNSNILKVYWPDGLAAGQQIRGNVIFCTK